MDASNNSTSMDKSMAPDRPFPEEPAAKHQRVGDDIVSLTKVHINCAYSYSEWWGQTEWRCSECNANLLLMATTELCRRVHGVVEVGYHLGGLVRQGFPTTCSCGVQWVWRQ